MTRKTVVQCASLAFVSAVTASFGMTSFVTADTISHTGAHSPQEHKIKPIIKNKCEIDTENNVDIENENKQKAESGDVTIKGEEHKKDEHNKWESETPKDEVQPSSAESSDQAAGQPMAADQAAATLAETDQAADQQTASKPESDENWKSDHEDHNQSKVGNVTTGDAINSNESKFEVNIETDNECPIIKKVPRVHKPEHKVQPSMKPKVTPSKAAAPQVSAGAGQGVSGGQGGGFGAGVAPRAQVQQPVAQPSKPVQPPAPKPAAPCPPEQAEHVSNSFKATTTNNVSISNTNYQHAESGSATVSGNTHVGNVSTGDAVNHNSTHASVNIETSNTAN